MIINDKTTREKYLGEWSSYEDIELHKSYGISNAYYAQAYRLISPYHGVICSAFFNENLPKGLNYELLRSPSHNYKTFDENGKVVMVNENSNYRLDKMSKLICKGCDTEFFQQKPLMLETSTFELEVLSKKLVIGFFTEINKVVDLADVSWLEKFATYVAGKYDGLSEVRESLPVNAKYDLLEEFIVAVDYNIAKLILTANPILSVLEDVSNYRVDSHKKIRSDISGASYNYNELMKTINEDYDRDILRKMLEFP